MRRGIAVALLVALVGAARGIGGASVIDEWATAAVPSPPPVKAVTVDPKTTALLVLDFLKDANCSPAHPRCVATVPHVAPLLAAARAKGMLVVYSAYPTKDARTDTVPELAPRESDPAVVSTVNKFLGTTLDATLKAKGITTLIITGTVAHGAVLYTASEAAQRGYAVVVPVDGMSSDSVYSEQTAAILLMTAPTVAGHVTLTTTALVTIAS